MSAPSAPTVTPSGIGGSIAAGDYYFVITESDGDGETSKSGETHANTTGTTSSIVITSPTNPGVQGSFWTIYCGTASGGPYWYVSNRHVFGANVTLSSTPPTSGVQAPGTDRSQQNAAQVAIDGSTINATSSGATAVMTLSGYTPTAADVGNTVQVLTGTNATAGFYEIVGWSSTTWVLNANWCTGAVTSSTGNMGGALATPGKAVTAYASFNRVFVKAGTYNISTGISDVSGAAAIYWIGYNTTRSWANSDATTAVWDAAANGITMLTINVQKCVVANISFTNSPAHTNVSGLNIGAANCLGRLISADDMTSTVNAAISVTGSTLERCKVTTKSGFAISGGSTLVGCVGSATNSSTGVFQITGQCVLFRCVAINCLSGVSDFYCSGGSGVFINCLSYGNQAGVVAGGYNYNAQPGFAYNCVAYHNSGVGFAIDDTAPISRIINCAAGDCTEGNISGGTALVRNTQAINFITLTADPFTNAAGDDFSLNSTAGGGAALKAAGYPATWPVLSTTNYPDVGLADVQATSGGSGGAILARQFLGMGG